MKAILLIGYGAPEKIEDIPDYYRIISGNRKVSPGVIHELVRRYMAIGSGSPVNRIFNEIKLKLQLQLPHEYQVFVGMRNWHPFIEKVVPHLKDYEEVIAVPLTPFYSRFHTEKYFEKLNDLKVRKVVSWYRHLVKPWARLMDGCDKSVVVFSAHSLPEAADDPYEPQVRWLAEEIAKILDIPRWYLAFQSKPMKARGKWLGPDIHDVISKLIETGERMITVAPIGFLHDSMEVLYDLDVELPMRFKDVRFCRVLTFNSDDMLIDVLKNLILEK